VRSTKKLIDKKVNSRVIKMERITVYQLLQKLRQHSNKRAFLEEIEDKYNKDVKLDVMIADYSDRLVKKGFNLNEYLKPYQNWNSYERMKLLKNRVQEYDDPVVRLVLNIIQHVNSTFTNEQKRDMRNKMKEFYFASLCNSGGCYYFRLNEDYYDTLNDMYSERVPNIFIYKLLYY